MPDCEVLMQCSEILYLSTIQYLSLRFNGHFPGEPGLASVSQRHNIQIFIVPSRMESLICSSAE